MKYLPVDSALLTGKGRLMQIERKDETFTLTHYDCNASENALFNEIIDGIYRYKVVKNDVKFTIA